MFSRDLVVAAAAAAVLVGRAVLLVGCPGPSFGWRASKAWGGRPPSFPVANNSTTFLSFPFLRWAGLDWTL